MNCAIVDDEVFSIELLADKIKLFPNLTLVKKFTDPTVALLEINDEDGIDILFLNISMPRLTGLELGAKLRQKVRYLIFTSNSSKYAIEAFDIRAHDYLLKPIKKTRFIICIQSILLIEQNKYKAPNTDLLFVKSNLKGKFISIKLNEVILIYVEGHKLFIITKNQVYETSESLKNIENRLSNVPKFLRVHNSNMINIEKIIKIEGNTIDMSGNYKVPVSESYKSTLMNVIGINFK